MNIKELIEKYPKIFVPYEGNPGYINYLDLPEMWIPVIDKLCGCIQDYIDNSKETIFNPEYIQGSKFNFDDITTRPYINIDIPQLVCTQMKEKFAQLRFYYEGGNRIIEGMIKMAEYECWNMCIKCGSKEDIITTKGGWISRICKKCNNE